MNTFERLRLDYGNGRRYGAIGRAVCRVRDPPPPCAARDLTHSTSPAVPIFGKRVLMQRAHYGVRLSSLFPFQANMQTSL
jgi:hypothetical protein